MCDIPSGNQRWFAGHLHGRSEGNGWVAGVAGTIMNNYGLDHEPENSRSEASVSALFV